VRKIGAGRERGKGGTFRCLCPNRQKKKERGGEALFMGSTVMIHVQREEQPGVPIGRRGARKKKKEKYSSAASKERKCGRQHRRKGRRDEKKRGGVSAGEGEGEGGGGKVLLDAL